jgi:hypothetical protein
LSWHIFKFTPQYSFDMAIIHEHSFSVCNSHIPFRHKE